MKRETYNNKGKLFQKSLKFQIIATVGCYTTFSQNIQIQSKKSIENTKSMKQTENVTHLGITLLCSKSIMPIGVARCRIIRYSLEIATNNLKKAGNFVT